jgi:hypothetical protein
MAGNRWRDEIDPFARLWFTTALSRQLKVFGYEP